jgi:hypothetical protein
MVNKSTKINKFNNHLLSQIIERKKKTMTYDDRNPGPGLGVFNATFNNISVISWQSVLAFREEQTCGGVRLDQGITILSS